jgi:hypothetical protein
MDGLVDGWLVGWLVGGEKEEGEGLLDGLILPASSPVFSCWGVGLEKEWRGEVVGEGVKGKGGFPLVGEMRRLSCALCFL